MLATKITNVGIDDKGGYAEYLADRLSGGEDLVAYMGEKGQAPSRWMGGGAGELRLSGEVDLHTIRELSGARDPIDGTQIGGIRPKWGAFELALSAAKDVAALWAISDAETRAVIEECGWEATAWAVETAEGLGAALGRGSIQRRDVTYRSAGLISAVWMHGASRASDPQLHWHVYTVNRVKCDDGQWRSLHSDVLTRASRTAISSSARARLQQLLTERLGVGWVEQSPGRWRIAGMPVLLTDEWSKRRLEIVKDAEAATKEHQARLKRDAEARDEPAPKLADRTLDAMRKAFGTALADKRRARKRLDEPEAERFERWRHEAAEITAGVEQVLDAVTAAGAGYRTGLEAWQWPERWPDLRSDAPAAVGSGPQMALGRISAALEARTTWLRRDVMHVAASFVPAGADARWVEMLTDEALKTAAEITAEVTDPNLIPAEIDDHTSYGDPTQRRWQSMKVWRAERAIEDAYLTGIAYGAPTAPGRPDWDNGLSAAQAKEIERVCSSGDTISCIVGPAGSGKTTIMATLERRFATAGYDVTGLAVSAAAVKELVSAGVEDSRTITSVLSTAGRGKPREPMGQVWVYDEASMANTLEFDQVVQMARDAKAKLVLVGDPAQLGAVGAGGMFAYLVDQLGAAQALEEVHRFRNDWEGANSLRLRSGDPEALDVLAAHGRITGAADLEAAKAAARAFTEQTLAAGSVPLILAGTRRHVHELNAAAREALRLGPTVYERTRHDLDPDRSPTTQSFAAGDIIVTGRNAKRILDSTGDSIRNGDRWRITGRSRRGGLIVERLTDDNSPGATAELPHAYIAGADPDNGRPWIEHGIATTVHRAQGRTVDHTLAFGDNRTTRNALYVDLSRARWTNRLVMIGAADDTAALEAAKAAQRRLDAEQSGRAYTTASTPAPSRSPGAAAHVETDEPSLEVPQLVAVDPTLPDNFNPADYLPDVGVAAPPALTQRGGRAGPVEEALEAGAGRSGRAGPVEEALEAQPAALPPPRTRSEFFERARAAYSDIDKVLQRFGQLREDPAEIEQAWRTLQIIKTPRTEPALPDAQGPDLER